MIEIKRLLHMNYYTGIVKRILALDDFILTDPINPLVEIADIIKIDFLKYSVEERNDIINIWEAFIWS